MRIKTRLLTAIVAVLMLLTITGCGNIDNSDTSNAEESESRQVETAGESASATAAQPTPQISTATGEKTGFKVGDVLPDFSLPLAGGGTFTLSDNRGKPVFINIFATWCPPCIGEMPEIDQLFTELGDQVAFLVIDIGEDEATALDFAESNGYSLPFAYSLDGAPFGTDYYFDYIPQTFVLSADGKIVWSNIGASDYEGFKAAIDAATAQ